MRATLAAVLLAATVLTGTAVAANAVPGNVKIPTAKPAPTPCTCPLIY